MTEPLAPSEDDYSYGEKLVGNGSNQNDPMVAGCKQAFAKIIDRLNVLRHGESNGEKLRHIEIAITKAQEAQMWAVKAITY